MGKQLFIKNKKGYTLVELLFVISVMSMISTTFVYYQFALQQTVKKSATLLTEMQNKSQLEHVYQTVEFKETSVMTQEKELMYYRNVILANPQLISFNEHGHSSKATTLLFTSKKYQQSIVIWLGGGFFDVKSIERRSID